MVSLFRQCPDREPHESSHCVANNSSSDNEVAHDGTFKSPLHGPNNEVANEGTFKSPLHSSDRRSNNTLPYFGEGPYFVHLKSDITTYLPVYSRARVQHPGLCEGQLR